MKVLVLCTGNSCRSQMAEGFLRSFGPEVEAYSAGTAPAPEVHPKAVQVMEEAGISLEGQQPELVDKYLDQSFDYVITVCGNAKENCPYFSGEVKQHLHIGFEDPAEATGSEEEILWEFRKIRDQIRERFLQFYQEA